LGPAAKVGAAQALTRREKPSIVCLSMPPLRRARLAVAASLLLSGASCDTLNARHRASRAAAQYKEGNIAAAVATYEEARGLDPSIATLHLNLGFGYLSLFEAAPRGPDAARNADGAVRELEAYIAMRPADPRGRQYLIQAFVDSKHYDDAVAFFTPELQRDPPSLEAISLLGQIAAKVGRFDDALGWYERRVQLRPDETEGLEGLGVLIWDHLHSHPAITDEARRRLADRGIAALARAVALRPGDAEAYSYWNLLLRERAAGYPCALPDGGLAPGAPGTPAGADGGVAPGCAEEKARDLAEADRLMRLASELFRARATAQPATAPATATKGGK
jgi:tetratricopeptide (TPR) repeat protein